jgi:hypothetical protein
VEEFSSRRGASGIVRDGAFSLGILTTRWRLKFYVTEQVRTSCPMSEHSSASGPRASCLVVMRARKGPVRPLGRCWIAPGEGSLAMGLLLDAIPTLGGSPSGAPRMRRNTTTVMMVRLGGNLQVVAPPLSLR